MEEDQNKPNTLLTPQKMSFGLTIEKAKGGYVINGDGYGFDKNGATVYEKNFLCIVTDEAELHKEITSLSASLIGLIKSRFKK